MRILGLDTATSATVAAVLELDRDGHEQRAIERRDDPPAGSRPRHTAALLSLALAALHEAGAGWADVDLIAVGTGPGTFTGLRIGIATARGLAHARGIPIVGVSTLRSLAAGAAAPAADGHLPVAVLDARRGEAFAAAWADPRADHDATPPLIAPAAMDPATLAQRLADPARSWLAVGDGAVRFRGVLEGSGAQVPADGAEVHRVSAAQHCRLASELPRQAIDDVRPEYLRIPDAELALQARTAAVPTP
jgi:tRNA threonylcarbamoyladenosine biosynthesis protein TsaB